MSPFDFELTEYCDGKGRVARVVSRGHRDDAPEVGEYALVEGPRADWADTPDDPFDVGRRMADRVAHASKENSRGVRRAWEAVRTAREHPLYGTPGIEGEERYYHAVLSLYARWFAEYGVPFPSLPPLPMEVQDPAGTVDDRLVLKARDVQRLLSVSADRLGQLVAEGRLVPVRYVDGGDRYFTRRSVEAFVEDLERGGYKR